MRVLTLFRPSAYFPLEIQPSKEFLFFLRLSVANEEELELFREDTTRYFNKRVTDSKYIIPPILNTL